MGKIFIVSTLSLLSLTLYASSLTLFGESSQDGYKYFEVGYKQDLGQSADFEIRAGGAQETGIPTSGNISFRYGVVGSDFFRIGLGGKYIRDASTFSPGFGVLTDFTFTISEWWKGVKYTDLVLKAEYMNYATPFANQRLGQITGGVEFVQEFTSWLTLGVGVKKFNYSLQSTGGSTSVTTRIISSKLGGMDGYPDLEKALFVDITFSQKWSLSLAYTNTSYLELADDAQNSSANLNYQLSKAIGLGISFVNFKEAESSNLMGLEFSYSW